ncbi:MAG: GLPGLI family protein [Flavobacteriaceae bacterium]|nr:GLPGLI family protein [Flavobacteriaceae bacterium]
MKKLILLAIATLAINNSFSQNLKVLYSEKVVIPSYILKNLTENEKVNLFKKNRSKYYTLIHQKNKSVYFLIPKIKHIEDTIKRLGSHKVIINKVIKIRGLTKNIIYKNLKQDTFINERTFLSKDYNIKDKLPVYNWHLINEVKKINEINTSKAETTYNNTLITAWYAKSIPINDGPSLFYGLPGLIIELNYGNKKIIEFYDIKFLKESKPIKPPINIASYITYQQYNKEIKQLQRDMLLGKCDTCQKNSIK